MKEKIPALKYKLHSIKKELHDRYGVIRLGFFDCYVDTHHTHDCEMNVLVELSRPLGWEFFAMKEFIERKIQHRIDICTPQSIKPALLDEIMAETHFV